ncbi:MAG TPA: hypothetical protein PLU55_01825, partial [Candidatus Pacearchaeota archaeon]|nr:hypothetical protein [Candidatus Pacearchaeota archaeon]
GILTLVLPATSPIFCSVVACANVGHTSLNRLSHLVQGSQSIKVQSTKSVAPVASTIALSTCHKFGTCPLCVAVGTIGLFNKVLTQSIIWFPVSFTTLLSIFLPSISGYVLKSFQAQSYSHSFICGFVGRSSALFSSPIFLPCA